MTVAIATIAIARFAGTIFGGAIVIGMIARVLYAERKTIARIVGGR